MMTGTSSFFNNAISSKAARPLFSHGLENQSGEEKETDRPGWGPVPDTLSHDVSTPGLQFESESMLLQTLSYYFSFFQGFFFFYHQPVALHAYTVTVNIVKQCVHFTCVFLVFIFCSNRIVSVGSFKMADFLRGGARHLGWIHKYWLSRCLL